jgi:4-hydroxythreonine-4-phosphate dehydrogenase
MTVTHERPIVITMGDPSGVGAEVTVKALAALPPSQRADFAIIGDRCGEQRRSGDCRHYAGRR